MKSILDLMHEDAKMEQIKAKKRFNKTVLVIISAISIPLVYSLVRTILQSVFFNYKLIQIDFIKVDFEKSTSKIYFKGGFKSQAPLDFRFTELHADISLPDKKSNSSILEVQIPNTSLTKGEPCKVDTYIEIKKINQSNFIKAFQQKAFKCNFRGQFEVKIFGYWFRIRRKFTHITEMNSEQNEQPIENITFIEDGIKVSFFNQKFEFPHFLFISIPQLIFNLQFENQSAQIKTSRISIIDGKIKSEISLCFIPPDKGFCMNRLLLKLNTVLSKDNKPSQDANLDLKIVNLEGSYDLWNDFVGNFDLAEILLSFQSKEKICIQNRAKEPVIYIFQDSKNKDFYISKDFQDDFAMNAIMSFFPEIAVHCTANSDVICKFKVKRVKKAKIIKIECDSLAINEAISSFIYDQKFIFRLYTPSKKVEKMFQHVFAQFSASNGLIFSFFPQSVQRQVLNAFEFHHSIQNINDHEFRIRSENYKPLDHNQEVVRIFYVSSIEVILTNFYYEMTTNFNFTVAFSKEGHIGLSFISEMKVDVKDRLGQQTKPNLNFTLNHKYKLKYSSIKKDGDHSPLYYYLIDNTAIDICEIKQIVRCSVSESMCLKPESGIYLSNRIFYEEKSIRLKVLAKNKDKKEIFAGIMISTQNVLLNFSTKHKFSITNLIVDSVVDFCELDAINRGFCIEFISKKAFCNFLHILSDTKNLGGSKISRDVTSQIHICQQKSASAYFEVNFKGGLMAKFQLVYDIGKPELEKEKVIQAPGMKIYIPSSIVRILNKRQNYVIIIKIAETSLKFCSLTNGVLVNSMPSNRVLDLEFSLLPYDLQMKLDLANEVTYHINCFKSYFYKYFKANVDFHLQNFIKLFSSNNFDTENAIRPPKDLKIQVKDSPTDINFILNDQNIEYMIQRTFSFFKLLGYDGHPATVKWSHAILNFNVLRILRDKKNLFSLTAFSRMNMVIHIDYDRPDESYQVKFYRKNNIRDMLNVPVNLCFDGPIDKNVLCVSSEILLGCDLEITTDIEYFHKPNADSSSISFKKDSICSVLFYIEATLKNINIQLELQEKYSFIVVLQKSMLFEFILCSHQFKAGKSRIPFCFDFKNFSKADLDQTIGVAHDKDTGILFKYGNDCFFAIYPELTKQLWYFAKFARLTLPIVNLILEKMNLISSTQEQEDIHNQDSSDRTLLGACGFSIYEDHIDKKYPKNNHPSSNNSQVNYPNYF